MTLSWWAAHILAMRLSVPEPVVVKMTTIWPNEQNRWAQVSIVGARWVVEIDREAWKKHPGRRAWLVAHKLCHTAHATSNEADANRCAAKVLRDHREER